MKRGRDLGIAGFVFEIERQEERAVVADFEKDLRALLGHVLEEAVGVEAACAADGRVERLVPCRREHGFEAANATGEEGIGGEQGAEHHRQHDGERGPLRPAQEGTGAGPRRRCAASGARISATSGRPAA
jgi:hypothetical protein